MPEDFIRVAAILTLDRLESIHADFLVRRESIQGVYDGQPPYDREQLERYTPRYHIGTTESSQRGMMNSENASRKRLLQICTHRELEIGYYFGHCRHPDDVKCPIDQWDKTD